MGHVDLQPAFSGLLRTCDAPSPEGSKSSRLSWALLPVQRHPLASSVNLSLPHSAPSPLELSQLLRGLLLASFRDLISCRGHSSGFRLQSLPHTDSRDHFWPNTLLTLRAKNEPRRPSRVVSAPHDAFRLSETRVANHATNPINKSARHRLSLNEAISRPSGSCSISMSVRARCYRDPPILSWRFAPSGLIPTRPSDEWHRPTVSDAAGPQNSLMTFRSPPAQGERHPSSPGQCDRVSRLSAFAHKSTLMEFSTFLLHRIRRGERSRGGHLPTSIG